MKAEKGKLALGASVLSAIAASLCCIGPLVSLLLGLGGFAAASVLAKWRPLFLVASLASLALAWYLTYRKPKTQCSSGASCAARPARNWNKVVLWVATVAVIVTTAFPIYSGAIARWLQAVRPAESSDHGEPVATLKVRIPSMDCAACAASIQGKLQRESGVESAKVSFDTKDAVVQYDPQKTSPRRIIKAINQTGFKAQL